MDFYSLLIWTSKPKPVDAKIQHKYPSRIKFFLPTFYITIPIIGVVNNNPHSNILIQIRQKLKRWWTYARTIPT